MGWCVAIAAAVLVAIVVSVAVAVAVVVVVVAVVFVFLSRYCECALAIILLKTSQNNLSLHVPTTPAHHVSCFAPTSPTRRFPVILRLSSDELPPCIKNIQPCRYTSIFSQLWFLSPWISCLAISQFSIVFSAFVPSLV